VLARLQDGRLISWRGWEGGLLRRLHRPLLHRRWKADAPRGRHYRPRARRAVRDGVVVPSTGKREMTTPTYVLGHSQRELERLGTQARLVDPMTRHFF